MVVARLESFITGRGLEDALERACVYRDHGADAILCHSKRNDAAEILEFMNVWNKGDAKDQCPVIILPTTYPSVSAETFEEAGISGIIWANHSVRASISAMQNTCNRIFREKSILNTEDEVVSVKEIFRLQRQSDLTRDEGRYLPSDGQSTRTYGVEHYLASD